MSKKKWATLITLIALCAVVIGPFMSNLTYTTAYGYPPPLHPPATSLPPENIHFAYLPYVANPWTPEGELQSRWTGLQGFIDTLYQDDSMYGVVKEYLGCPLTMRERYTGEFRQAGEYSTNKTTPFAKILDQDNPSPNLETQDITYYMWELGSDYQYDMPVYCRTIYSDNGDTDYTVHVNDYGFNQNGSYIIWHGAGKPAGTWDLYVGNTLALSDVTNINNSTQAFSTVTIQGGTNRGALGTFRYSLRNANYLAAMMYAKRGGPGSIEFERAGKIYNSIYGAFYGLGSIYEIYAPMDGSSSNSWPDDFMFTNNAYIDCSLYQHGVDTYPYPKFEPYKYFYESKVCLNRPAYITLSRLDYLAPALQAIHILNKYNDPDHQYANPDTTKPLTTPRLMARWLESKWNGTGIPAYGKDASYSSGVRTNAFALLETFLGYKYNDTTSRSWADLTMSKLYQVQWGYAPNPNNYGWAIGNGWLKRPAYNGSILLSWKAYPDINYGYGLPDAQYLQDLLDLFSMPAETLNKAPSNAETSISAWFVYYWYWYYKYYL